MDYDYDNLGAIEVTNHQFSNLLNAQISNSFLIENNSLFTKWINAIELAKGEVKDDEKLNSSSDNTQEK